MTKFKNYILANPIAFVIIAVGLLLSFIPGFNFFAGMVVGVGLGNLFGKALLKRNRGADGRFR